MRNFPIGRYPLAETVWRYHTRMEEAVDAQGRLLAGLCADYAGQLDRNREKSGIPSMFD